MSDDDDEVVLPPAGPLPIVLGHLLGMGLHVLTGASLVAAVWMGPLPFEVHADAASQTRFWLAGIVIFATLVALAFSTAAAVAAYRVVTLFFARSGPGRQRLAMVAGVLVAHGIGWAAGLGGAVVGYGGTAFGEHQKPWETAEQHELNRRR